jgi:hypothetical protein
MSSVRTALAVSGQVGADAVAIRIPWLQIYFSVPIGMCKLQH